ncbi:MAG: glycosyltransferase [Chitinophagales bacterium]
MRKKKFLVCVLNWGMGHATRCIPIINELLKRDQEVIICSDGDALELLKEEFPQLEAISFPAYNPIYSKGESLMGKMLVQMPKFMKAIRNEHELTEKLVHERKIDIVFSDNRYGCYSEKVRSIFMTHQISLMVPGAFGLMEPFVNYYNRKLIRNFDRLWIPDFKDDRNISGNLSFSSVLPRKYIGQLSRLTPVESTEHIYDIIGLISGPEPQRTIFEDLLRHQFHHVKGKTLLVKGKASGTMEITTNGRHSEVDFLNSSKLNEALSKSSLVIARSGYSTIMDLAKMGKHAILVPTPGQTEQLYLGKRLMKMGIALMKEQKDLKLERALVKNKLYTGFEARIFDNELLTAAIEKLLK